MKNFYEQKLEEIKLLMATDKKGALTMVNEELAMPYIPEKYEVEFIKIADKISFESKGDIKTKEFSHEKLTELLFSGDNLKEATAIDALRSKNIRSYLTEIEKWIFLNNENKVGQAIIYEMLVEQEIDKEINFGDYKINPFKNKSIMDETEVRKAFKIIMKNNDSTPQIEQASINELQHYLLKTFPERIDDGKLFGACFYNVIKGIFNGETIFKNMEEKIYRIIKQN